MAMLTNPDPWLSPADVTAIYKISKATLSVWRAQRKGPPFRKLGRAVHYRNSDVDAFIEAHIIHTTDQEAEGGPTISGGLA